MSIRLNVLLSETYCCEIGELDQRMKTENGSLFNDYRTTQVIINILAMNEELFVYGCNKLLVQGQLTEYRCNNEDIFRLEPLIEVLNPSLTGFNCMMQIDIHLKISRTIMSCTGW